MSEEVKDEMYMTIRQMVDEIRLDVKTLLANQATYVTHKQLAAVLGVLATLVLGIINAF